MRCECSETDGFLPLSGLQHVVFCERQAALIHIERVWQENTATALGRIVHERADQPGPIYAAGGATTIWVDFKAQKSAPMPDWLRRIVE
mgnify:CR=1 FL=1